MAAPELDMRLRKKEQTGSVAFDLAKQKTEHSQNQKNKEQCLGNAHRTRYDTAKAEQRGKQRDDKKDGGIVQHQNS
jgi:hypothetical protein